MGLAYGWVTGRLQLQTFRLIWADAAYDTNVASFILITECASLVRRTPQYDEPVSFVSFLTLWPRTAPCQSSSGYATLWVIPAAHIFIYARG